MPMAPLRQCTAPGCNARQAGARCPAHAVPSWRSASGATVERMRGGKLQRARALLFGAHPLCAMCGVRLAEIRDHVVPLAEGGRDEPGNVQALCLDCSNAKTKMEAQRGRSRHR